MIQRLNWPNGNGDWQPEGKVVEANAFILLDDQGLRRGMMFVKEGTAILSLLNASGEPRVSIHAAADGLAAVGLNDSKGVPRSCSPFKNQAIPASRWSIGKEECEPLWRSPTTTL